MEDVLIHWFQFAPGGHCGTKIWRDETEWVSIYLLHHRQDAKIERSTHIAGICLAVSKYLS
jgi:hypothetical protein